MVNNTQRYYSSVLPIGIIYANFAYPCNVQLCSLLRTILSKSLHLKCVWEWSMHMKIFSNREKLASFYGKRAGSEINYLSCKQHICVCVYILCVSVFSTQLYHHVYALRKWVMGPRLYLYLYCMQSHPISISFFLYIAMSSTCCLTFNTVTPTR